ncbi:hypothetical protein ACG2LH_10595 [Zhouia sp. PK063]|uniref:hypothetical protein n=1 Tax=Zhouia sp. PK063 TaxID=3373602 RepID=UPI00378CDAD4
MKKILYTKGRNYQIIDNKKKVCEVFYYKWYSEKASGIYNLDRIQFFISGVINQNVTILKNDQPIGTIKYNLRGYMVLNIKDENGAEKTYFLKIKTVWRFRIEVFDEQNNMCFIMHSYGKWYKAYNNFKIEELASTNTNINELLVYCAYAANWFINIAVSAS